MSMSFANLEHAKDILNYQGSQIPWQGFDELTHFYENQFFYMLSRNRSTSGVKPRIRATCNPDPDSFVRRLIDWWIGVDGYPIRERAGKLRWFIRINDEMIWADSKEAIFEKYGRGDDIQPTSITFIPSKLEDNKILMNKDPAYAARLLALNRVDRMRLKEGNWNVRAEAGSVFQRQWFTILDAIPSAWMSQCRYWDRAATKPSESNKDPDWSRGLRLLKYPNGTCMVADLKSIRDTPGQVERLVLATASHDSVHCPVIGEQDPGSAGVADAENFVRLLNGYEVRTRRPTKDKVTRAKPVSAQSEAGNIFVLRAPWNEEFFRELENFPDGSHDDIVDVLSGAYNELNVEMSAFDIL
jgi:predicted phage terminase large subunit-like protein